MTTRSVTRRKRRGGVTVAQLLERHGEPRLRGGRHRYVKPDDSPTREFYPVSVASTVSSADDGEDEPTWANRDPAHHRAPTKAQMFWGSVLIAATIVLSSFHAAPVIV